jgi:uncharacterized protein (TIGR00369 family)
MSTYPPDRHLLRDLRLAFDHSEADMSRAWLPIVPEICGDDGAVRAGALAVLVDVIGGGRAAAAAHPNWIATADLTLHLTAAATEGTVEALARVLRTGRTTVVLEVTLHCDAKPIGLATMSFSVLPRRDINPDMGATTSEGPSTMALDGSGMTAPFVEMIGITTVEATTGAVELPVRDWAKNSMGALQGGVVGMVVEASAEAALRRATGRPLVVTDLQCSYLSFGKVGPLRTSGEVLEASDDRGMARVTLVDDGAEARKMTRARAVATKSLR